jgi:hypothetical protein
MMVIWVNCQPMNGIEKAGKALGKPADCVEQQVIRYVLQKIKTATKRKSMEQGSRWQTEETDRSH